MSDCVLWQRAKISGGYGCFREKGKLVYAHRRSWEEANGRTLESHEIVHHLCETPACVNPDHLEIKTQDVHAHDHNRQITDEDVVEIRRLRGQGFSYRAIEMATGWSRETARRWVKDSLGRQRKIAIPRASR